VNNPYQVFTSRESRFLSHENIEANLWRIRFNLPKCIPGYRSVPISSPLAGACQETEMQPFLLKFSPRAFTLIELLVVMAVIIILTSFLVPAFNSIKGGDDLTKVVYDIAGTLEQARAYAIANHTYVWVGIGEFDASRDASASPQVSGTGRVAIVLVASKDGTRGYDVMNGNLAITPWPTLTGETLMPVTSVRYFNNIHLNDSGVLNGAGTPGTSESSPSVGSGGMLRYYINSDSTQPYILRGGANTGCVTQFAWPLGTVLNSSSAKYSFATVINYDPQGEARIQTKNNTDTLTPYMEASVQATHGTRVNPAETNVAAIQINCTTGRVRIYRP
jgi:prepilin-type N-terminal cleavage/methylation domain-containing protein